jgi:hypothetical protein
MDYSSPRTECPLCSAVLEVEHIEEGFALIGATEEEKNVKEDPFTNFDDPVIEDYLKWRGRAVFVMVLGGALAFIMILISINGMSMFGIHYFRIGNNFIYITGISLVSFLLITGAGWFFRYLGIEREKYIKGDRQ